MKKIVFLIVLFFIFTLSVSAQIEIKTEQQMKTMSDSSLIEYVKTVNAEYKLRLDLSELGTNPIYVKGEAIVPYFKARKRKKWSLRKNYWQEKMDALNSIGIAGKVLHFRQKK